MHHFAMHAKRGSQVRVLVTGGAGYIGSVTVECLIEQGNTVAVLDNLSQGHREAVHPEARLFEHDLADKKPVEAVMREFQPEVVMHFASRTLVGESMEEPFLYLGENVRNGLNLLESAVANGVQRLILSSTANLFDQPEKLPIDEAAQVNPGSPYGESKQILERMLYWLDRTNRLRFTALRYFNAAGATSTRGEDHDPETHLIPIVLEAALGKRESITVFGDDYDTPDGTCVRDYVHVLDLAQAHILAMGEGEDRSSVYNLGNGNGFSVQDVIDVARKVTGREIPVKIGPRRPGDPAKLVASSEKIKRELGWNPRFATLEDIISTAWNWHQAHPDGYSEY